jgi:hypothetical protein
VTGKPVTNATVWVSQRWTSLPLEEIPFIGIDTCSRITTNLPKNGTAKFTGIRKGAGLWLVIEANGYAQAQIIRRAADLSPNPEAYQITYFGDAWLHDSPYAYAKRNEPFTLTLEPTLGGTERLGERYPLPPPESKERALAAVIRYANATGNPKPHSIRFVNGHWAIDFRPGGTRYDVSAQGEILGIAPAACNMY